MRALTICEPYASLICLPDADPRAKRVENRTWYTRHRGPLAIHAGKSRDWLCEETGVPWPDGYGMSEADLTFGALLGVAVLIDCVHIDRIMAGDYDRQIPWLREHAHVSGPWCWVLRDVRRLPEPVPLKGGRGLFEVPDELLPAAVEPTMFRSTSRR